MPNIPTKSVISRRQFGIVVLVFLAVMAIRITQINLSYREFHVDEVWSVWQSLGTHTDYYRQTSWPPLYSALLDGWRRLVGIDPISLRFSSLLFLLIGITALYRAVRRLAGHSAGLLTVLGYSGLAVNQYLSGQVRDYALALALLPIAFWLTLRYFDHPRPLRGILLGAAMAAMFYNAYGSVGAFLLLGLYTLVIYRMAVWRWWLPGVVAGLLAAPEIARIATLAVGRTGALTSGLSPDYLGAVASLFAKDAGSSGLAWAVLFGVATLFGVLGLVARRRMRLPLLVLLAWGLSPFLLYVLYPYLGLFSAVYAWFITLGLLAWIGYGLSRLPSIGPLVAGFVLLAIMATPFNPEPLAAQALPLGTSFQWLAQHVRWGDVIVTDPLWKDRYCDCIQPEVFEFFTELYFPQGLQIVSDPTGYRRVWYVKWDSQEDRDFQARLEQGRVPGPFVGPPEALFRLYEAPPNPQGIPFANGMRFLGADLSDEATNLLVARDEDTVHLRLWWTVDKPLDRDFSVSLQVFNADNKLSIQSDSAPNIIIPTSGPRQTSQWQPGQLYVEQRDFEVPKGAFTTGAYAINLIVYDSQSGQRFSAPGANADSLLPIYTLNVKAW